MLIAYKETLYCKNSALRYSCTLSECQTPCCFVLCTLSIVQKCRNLILLMENSRIIYETLIKSRCSDSHWSKVKGLADTCGIVLDRQGLNLIINLRKLNPRYFNLYPQIQPCLIRLGESVSGSISSGLNGQEVIDLIQKELDIKPNISTIYRWFHRSGLKFRTYDFYDRKSVMLVMTNALIFKAKKARLKATN